MNTQMKSLPLVAVALALAGCGTQAVNEHRQSCATERRGDTLYFKAHDIAMSVCPYGASETSPGVCGPTDPYARSWQTAMYGVSKMSQGGREWRVPTRADMNKLGRCLPKGRWFAYYTVAEIAPDGKNVRTFNPTRNEYGWGDINSPLGTFALSGGDPALQAGFDKLVAQTVKPAVEREWAQQDAKHREQFAAWYRPAPSDPGQEQRDLLKRLGAAKKGEVMHCTSEDVVPVNWPLDRTAFSCPAGIVSTRDMRSQNWKIIQTERVPAQAADYNMSAYGMRNWNGRGVSIMVTAEKTK
jgi:hypothetical protein